MLLQEAYEVTETVTYGTKFYSKRGNGSEFPGIIEIRRFGCWKTDAARNACSIKRDTPLFKNQGKRNITVQFLLKDS
jgi:hypothetical protein